MVWLFITILSVILCEYIMWLMWLNVEYKEVADQIQSNLNKPTTYDGDGSTITGGNNGNENIPLNIGTTSQTGINNDST